MHFRSLVVWLQRADEDVGHVAGDTNLKFNLNRIKELGATSDAKNTQTALEDLKELWKMNAVAVAV